LKSIFLLAAGQARSCGACESAEKRLGDLRKTQKPAKLAFLRFAFGDFFATEGKRFTRFHAWIF
jgi:hypothetical protein